MASYFLLQNTRQGFSWTVTIVKYPKSSRFISLHIFFLQNTLQGFLWTVTIVRYPKISWVISLYIFFFRILDRVSHGQLQLCDIQRSAELYLFTFFISEYSTRFLMDSYNGQSQSMDSLDSLDSAGGLRNIIMNPQPGGPVPTPRQKVKRRPWVNSLRAKFFRGNINIYVHFMSLLHIDLAQVLKNPSSCKTGTYICYKVNIMAADVLAT